MIKTHTYLFLSLIFFFLPGLISAQIERVYVETYYISDGFDSTDADGGKLDTGSVTYRVYVDLMPGNKLRKIYGDKNHALKFSSTKPFFNNMDGETYAKDIKKGKYSTGTFALDTWLTLGQTAGKTSDGKANFGILKRQDTNGSFIGGANNDGGSGSIAGGLLTNTNVALGIPLTVADGMYALTLPTYTWNTFGIKDFLSGNDTTMFGSLKAGSEFVSYKTFLENIPGVTGVIPDSNQILVAQLTTKGKLTFELNIEVEQMVDTVPVIFKYVANGDTLAEGEKVSSYLKYPYAPVCGCKDPAFVEYSAKYECTDNSKCINHVVYGCKDTMACNFDPNANFSLPFLCCYPGSCNGRDISVVCPSIRGNAFECEIYPNPAQNTIFINATSGLDQNIGYSVFNYSGNEVLKKSLGVQQGTVSEEIDITALSNGLYLIKVSAGSEFVNIQFIKN